MTAVRRSLASCLILVAACLGAAGCVAEIREERFFGPPRTIVESKSEILEERRDEGAPDARASVCRDVVVTSPLVRDVTTRRYFGDNAQERNLAVTTLLGVGVALLAYGANQAACSKTTGVCPDFATVTSAEIALLAASSVPIAFIGYNALRVRDSHTIDYLTPQWVPGPWVSCEEREGRELTKVVPP